MLRLLLLLAIAVGLAYCGATVKLGKRTFFGHVRAIWHTEEVQDLKHGVEQTARPTVHRLEHGMKVGYEAFQHGDGGADHDGAAAHEHRAPAGSGADRAHP